MSMFDSLTSSKSFINVSPHIHDIIHIFRDLHSEPMCEIVCGRKSTWHKQKILTDSTRKRLKGEDIASFV